MQTKDNSGQAFPCPSSSGDNVGDGHFGMTLLDYFAGQALAGTLASFERDIRPSCEDGPNSIGSFCYKAAASLIVEREKRLAERSGSS